MNNKKDNIYIIGLGWGAVGFLTHINTKYYNVELISDKSYFLYTSLLPKAIFCDYTFNNICVPVTKFIKPGITFTKAKVKNVNFDKNTIDMNEKEVSYQNVILSYGAIFYDYKRI